MNRSLLPALLAASAVFGCGQPAADAGSPDVTEAVRDRLERQIADWNRGDIDAFMTGYRQSDDVRFASGGDVKTGWATVLNDYKARYPDRGAMGYLRTVEQDITALGADSALVFGRWIVTAGESAYCGLYTLVLRRMDGQWVIVHDHTSAADGALADGRTCEQLAAT